ncbi:dephospho-CoA kinase [Collinsella sp. zg1085]|uniref:dephospho-CoA kinase n=1 Tax=Collinsella sp. zg1085 TaxID=2844380 RepID=UPI001C0B7C60|nr:dephospho-CoA kinase [Collinsella sp. zg1085]QWT17235.1 dephospho-CoA kinase [Collinsella sp. zg1085]
MSVIYILGNIASGKTQAARYMQQLGACLINLDERAKLLYEQNAEVRACVRAAFGDDICIEDRLNIQLLAKRAFQSAEHIERLGACVYPQLLEDVYQEITAYRAKATASQHLVVEISAPRGFEQAFAWADDIIAITAPYKIRRTRAIARGMHPDDVDARAQLQPTDAEIEAMATHVISNTADLPALFAQLDAYLAPRCHAER